MPLTREMLDSDLRGVLADFPQTATFSRGAKRFSAPCAVSDVGGGASAGDGAAGIAWDDSVSLVVPAAECAFEPRPGDLLSVEGAPRKFRVESVRWVPGDAAYSIQGVPR